MYNLDGVNPWTASLKNAFKNGITHASVIYNGEDYNENNFLKEAELSDVRYVPNAGIFGQAVARMLTIKMVNDENSNLNYENEEFQFKIGAEYNNSIYYINYGNFIVNEPPENDDTNGTIKFVAYDYMIKFNKNYTNRVIYPCTLKDLLLDICDQAGVTLGSNTFLNDDFVVEDNQFEGKQLREVLQNIAKCAFSWARIGQDNKLYLDFEVNNNIDETITTDDYKMDAYKKANEYYGAINKVTFADSDIKGQEISVQDNASIAVNGVKEVIIYDNYFAYTTEKRQELIQAGTALFGLTYMPVQKLEMVGLVYLDCNDIIGIEDGNGQTILTRNFSHIIKYNGAVSDTLETIGESDNERTYLNQNNSVAQNSRTEIIVDRAKKQIQSIIEDVGEQDQKIAVVTQTVEELNSKISDIADITTSLESNSAILHFEDINQSEPIRIVIHPVGVNISKLYPSSSLKPNSNLKIKTRIIRFTNTTTNEVWNYELPDDLLYYDSENYDEFILDYDGLSCVVNKKCKWNNDGSVGLLSSTRTDEYTFPHIDLTDGDYTIQLIQYSNGYIFARLMAQNIYTTQFATKSELNSEINQAVDSIDLSVNNKLSNYSTTTEMNSAISLKANEITSEVSNNYATKSDLSTTQTSLNSKIDQTAENITSSVSATYSTKEQTATAKQEAISSSNSSTDTKLQNYSTKTETNNAKNQAINSANASTDTKLLSYSTTAQMNSAINQKANEITSSVSQTYSTKTETQTAKNEAINSSNSTTDTKLQSYSTTAQMNSAINQKANEITSTVSETYSTKLETTNAINGIEVGGKNILLNTGNYKDLSYWVKNGGVTLELSTIDNKKVIHALGSIRQNPNEIIYHLNWNTTYVYHSYVKFSKSGNMINSQPLHYWIYKTNNYNGINASNGAITINDFYVDEKGNKTITANKWHHLVIVFTTIVKPTDYEYVNFLPFFYGETFIDNNEGSDYYVEWIKLETGNKPTDWTPAPEDMATNKDLENYSTTVEMNSAISQTADTINARIDRIEDLTNEFTGTKTVTLANCVEGSILELHIYGNNSVFEHYYPLNNRYPSNTLYPKGDARVVVTSGNASKTYDLGITEVLRQNGSTQDEYILENGYAKVVRRINSDGTIKTNATTQNIGEFYIDLAEGTNTITIKNYSATLKVKYAIKSDYTNIFATKVEMNSSITQTAEEINLEVSKKVDSQNFGTLISQNAYNVRIAWNNNTKSVQFENNGIAFYNGENIEQNKRAVIDYNSNKYYRDGYYVGSIGTSSWVSNSSHKSLSFNLAPQGKFMSWGANDGQENYYVKLCYSRQGSIYTQEGLHVGCDMYGHWNQLNNFAIGEISAGGYSGYTGTIRVLTEVVYDEHGDVKTIYETDLQVRNGIIVGNWTD